MFEKRSNSPIHSKIPIELNKLKSKIRHISGKKQSLKSKDEIVAQNITENSYCINPSYNSKNNTPKQTPKHKTNDIKQKLRDRIDFSSKIRTKNTTTPLNITYIHNDSISNIHDITPTSIPAYFNAKIQNNRSNNSITLSPSIDKSMIYLRQKLLKQNNDDLEEQIFGKMGSNRSFIKPVVDQTINSHDGSNNSFQANQNEEDGFEKNTEREENFMTEEKIQKRLFSNDFKEVVFIAKIFR